MEENFKDSEISEILSYNGIEEEFIQYKKYLDEQINNPILNNTPGNAIKKFTGNLIDKNYEGTGILYDQKGGFKYKGNFKEGKYDGFGKLYEPSNGLLIYEGFFNNNNYCGKGILYKNGKKIYEGNFKNNKYESIGIEYLSNGKRKRKAKYHSGVILNECYGVLYDKNDNELYRGMLKNGIPKEGKSLILYDKDDYIIYEGDFSSFHYNGKGILYFEKSYQILFNGTFRDDKYLNGILYYIYGNKKYEGEFNNNVYNGNGILYYEKNNKIFCQGFFKNGNFISGKSYSPEGMILYEGEFKNFLPKKGKNIKSYELNGYLKYEGNFENFNYHDYGKLYLTIPSNPLLYEGEFKFGLFNGKGILYEKNYKKYEGSFANNMFNGIGKIYEIDDNKNHYLYYEGNFVDDKIWGKGVKYYVNGKIKIEGTFQNINSYEGKYYDPKKKEIFNGKITNEISMDFKDMILYNDLGNIIYDSKIYNSGYFMEEKKDNKNDLKNEIKKKKSNVTFLSCNSIPGKTCLLNRISGCDFNENTLATIGTDSILLNYEFNQNEYKLKLFDTAGAERFKSIGLKSVKISDIIIYLFDLSKDDDIKEDFIDSIKENYNNKEKLIYLIGNKLDLYESQKNIEKCRLIAKNLIDRGRINKYFELSAKTYEGVDFFLKYLKIDSAVLIDNKNQMEIPNSKEIKHKKCLII